MAATTPGARVGLTDAQLEEIRRWAAGVAANGADERVRAGTRAVAVLADEVERLRLAEAGEGFAWDDGEPPAPARPASELLDLKRAADAASTAGGQAGAAAARAASLLWRELEAAGRVEAAVTPPPEPPRRVPGLARPAPRAFLALLMPLAAAVLLVVGLRLAAPDLQPAGPAEGELVGGHDLGRLALSVIPPDGRVDDVRWTLDGRDVTDRAQVHDGASTLRLDDLADGEHEVEASLGGALLWSSASVSWRFAVDATPPAVEVGGDVLQAQVRSPFVLRGTAAGATSLTVNGERAALGRGGAFTVRYERPPRRGFELVARDAAGNEASRDVGVTIVPRLPAAPLRAVHVTADAWANSQLRADVLRLVDEGRINAVELDLKDEAGIIGWDAPVPFAREIGAVRDIYDLREAIELLHGRGVRVVGRLVAFRDPVHAEAAWRAGRKNEVVQTSDGQAYSGGYGGFTNFADPAVQQYNVDVAVAAAELGVDDILYDYVRRPDGPLETMRFPGLRGDPSRAVVRFLAEARRRLEPTGAFLGASVFGIAATRPDEIAQDVPAIAREVDYVAPMLYPSHWATGEYGLAHPNAQPYEIIRASLADFRVALEGSGARLVPWLQDFSLGVPYGADEVEAQIDAARDAGVREFLLWDPEVTYTHAALARGAKLPATGERPSRSGLPAVTRDPNELGIVPVLMYHQLLPDGGGEYDLTPDEFRAELERLWREGYRPIRASDLVSGTIDVPKGTTPVVLTFDDATANQAALTADGRIDPDTAAGILLEFARTHPGFEPAGTFYVNREPFAAEDGTRELIEALVDAGFELGSHTHDHLNLAELSDEDVQRQIVLGNRVVREYLPDAEIATFALPLGAEPQRPELARSGRWDGESYRFAAVMLVGAEPAPSPYSTAFEASAVPRVRSTPDRSIENGSADWLARLAADPALRFVSDGDPDRITVPAGREGEVAPRFADRVQPAARDGDA